jgi:hypothetical protein
MQIGKATVKITPEHSQVMYDLTPADALILQRLHFVGAKGNPITEITITGEAVVELKPPQAATEAEYDPRGRVTKQEQPAKPGEYRKRTDAEERVLLQKFYTGVIDTVPIFQKVFPDPTRRLPQTFKEVAEYIGNPTLTFKLSGPQPTVKEEGEESDGEGEDKAKKGKKTADE